MALKTGKGSIMHKLERYVGRIVRLNKDVFQDLARRSRANRTPPENCFLVAAVSREMRKLVCYGATLTVSVGASDVVLI